MKSVANPLITLVIALNGLSLSAQELKEQSTVDAQSLSEDIDWIDDLEGVDKAYSRQTHGKGFDKTSGFAKGFDKMYND